MRFQFSSGSPLRANRSILGEYLVKRTSSPAGPISLRAAMDSLAVAVSSETARTARSSVGTSPAKAHVHKNDAANAAATRFRIFIGFLPRLLLAERCLS